MHYFMKHEGTFSRREAAALCACGLPAYCLMLGVDPSPEESAFVPDVITNIFVTEDVLRTL